MSIFKDLFGGGSGELSGEKKDFIARVGSYEETFKTLSDEALKKKTDEFKDKLSRGDTLLNIEAEAFALVREAARRTLGQRHYDVQIAGGYELHAGHIAEMKTGEGKTLVATLPVYVNALAGKGVHVVTVNDYLSRRDAVWMGQIYNFLGLSVGVINHDTSYLYDRGVSTEKDKERDESGAFHIVREFLKPCSRSNAYAADITYGTNQEFGFDYLRDNIASSKESLVQRGYHYAIVDEVDSILIDEARTPLIISAPTGDAESLYPSFSKIARALAPGTDYEVDEKLKAIALTESGIEKAEKTLNVGNIYTEGGMKYVHHLETAIRAKSLFERDRDYVVKNGEIIIVDQFTGRLQPGRRWSEGLHQAIEAKEGVAIKEESRTLASITYQNYFKMYTKLAGMTGTAATSKEEFQKVYGLHTAVVPPHRPSARVDAPDLIFQTEKGKFQAIAQKIKELHDAGRPVLVGTVSIDKNELLSAFLKKEGVPHEILNAKNHEREGEIIADAGKSGSVVIATNMAGRGVDIKLGGTHASEKEYEDVKKSGGLFVLGTERHEARRIDNQLRGRAGRQGDSGETQFFISLEDSLMRVFASDKIKNMMGRFGIPEDEPIENRLVTRAIESAQEKIEGFHFDARRHVLEYDNVLNTQRQSVYGRKRKILLGDKETIENELAETLAKAPDEKREELEKTVAEKKEKMGEEVFWNTFQVLMLRTIDLFWMEHLEAMEYARGSVNLRAYGQRDPLVEYKNEGLRMFKELGESIHHYVLQMIPHMGHQHGSGETQRVASKIMLNQGSGSKSEKSGEYKDVGRNDPCPCGAKRQDGTLIKYKHCHGK